jgi:hypothetical protein
MEMSQVHQIETFQKSINSDALSTEAIAFQAKEEQTKTQFVPQINPIFASITHFHRLITIERFCSFFLAQCHSPHHPHCTQQWRWM